MFKCSFPNCDYSTNLKSQIHTHHIIPKELGGSNKKHNLIDLCPNHHSKIYVPESQKGIHSKKSDDSIVIEKKLSSTGGTVIEYRNANCDALKYHFLL